MMTTKQKLWTIFSLYIRLRDADQNGFCKCISCGSVHKFNDCDAGHFIPKNKGNSVYFLEENVHAQCRHCNSFLHGNLYFYGKALESKIGERALKMLEIKSKQILKYSEADYLKMISYYKEKVKEMKKEKSIE